MADTVSTVGPGKTYASLSLWEAGQQKTISSGNREVAQFYAFEDAPVVIDGWTIPAGAAIYIYTPTSERHDGKWNATKGRIKSSSADYLIYTSEPYVNVDGLQFHCDRGGAQNAIRIDAASGTFHINHCVVKATAGKASSNYRGILSSSGTTVSVTSCLFYDIDDAYSDGIAISIGGASNIYNCTLQNCDATGISGTSTTYVKNCLFRSCANATSGLTAANCDYNATDLSSLGYTAQSHDRVSQTFTFVDEGADDFHLTSGDAGAKDYGVSDPGSGLFSDDIDGQTRSGSWDIGADEYVAAGGGFVPYPIASRGARGGMLVLSGGLQ